MASHTFPALDTNNVFTGMNAFQQGVQGVGMHSQVFTANGTFVIPVGVTAVKVTVIGGGGAGGGSTNSVGSAGTGGGAGGCSIKWLTGLTPNNTILVTIGAGGVAVSGGSGGNGGSSSVASGTQAITPITAFGGGGGAGAGAAAGLGAGPGSGGDVNFGGASGWQLSAIIGGPGGESIFGGAASPIGGATPGQLPSAPGCGGGGAGGGGGFGNFAGGNGTSGLVIFEWVS